MLNQSFTPQNLRKIYDKENRKGDYIEKGFPPEIEELSLAIKRWRNVKKRLRKRQEKYSQEVYQTRLQKARDSIRSYDQARDKLINTHLEEISRNISKKAFKLQIEEHTSSHHDKKTYRIKPNLESFFSEKQVQQNIKSTYGVKQACRDVIISQLKSALNDNFPKQIIRTDITSFYESIDRKVLKDKINNNPRLSLASRKMIEQVMRGYEGITHNTKGIPRGVGISAYLAELYMSDADEKIKSLPGVIYYTRYVDDIVVIFSPSSIDSVEERKGKIATIMSDIGLSLNEGSQEKTKTITFKKGHDFTFDYLGYKFQHRSKKLTIGASIKKTTKYKSRIDHAFRNYHRSYGSSTERRILIDRIRLLTGNTKLTNNKGGAFIGIYSSNKWIDDLTFLDQLDHHLTTHANQLACPTLKRKILKLSFKDGFTNKRFRKFNTRDLGKITQAWKH